MRYPPPHNPIITRTRAISVVLLTATTVAACDSSPSDNGVDEPSVTIDDVVDLGTIDQGSLVVGRDGGYSGIVNGDVVWVFGDSVFTVADASGNTWLSNSFATGNPLDSNNSTYALLTGTDSDNRPATLLDYTSDELSYNANHQGENCAVPPCGDRFALWPGALARDDERNRTLMFYQKIHASPGEFNFYGVGQSIAIWNDGEPSPQRVVINAESTTPTLLFQPSEPPLGSGAIISQSYLYTFSCRIDNLDKPCILARVPQDDVLIHEAWEYWTGDEWEDDFRLAVGLFNGNDIMSVHYDGELNRFIAVYSKPLDRTIQLRTAAELTGPWSRPLDVTLAQPSQSGNGWVYDALAHPELTQDEEGLLYLTYTRDTGTTREMRLVQIQFSLAQ